MENDKWVKEALEKTLNKLSVTSGRIRDQFPQYTLNGKYNDETENIQWWTNGFWSGILWLAYRFTKNGKYSGWAVSCEEKLDKVLWEFDQIDHDAGFIWGLSAIADYKITGNDLSRRRGLLAASLLSARYNTKGKFIRAWNNEGRSGWTIIDSMMNLSILYWASGITGDPRFEHLAVSHADTVMKEFIREDGSSCHIVCFDPITGEKTGVEGGQGNNEHSAWSRGNSWALYGFALSYYYTREERYLNTAKRVANFFIAALPEDHVPFADLKAPVDQNIHKDSSAAACAASGLVLLAGLVVPYEKEIYLRAAKLILKSLYENYTEWNGEQEGFIQHGCIAFRVAEHLADTSLIYGDYFFLEALSQLNGHTILF